MRRAVSFLTPLGGAVTPSPRAVAWFPVVGAGIGLALGAVWWGAHEVWPGAVAAAIVVAADLALTGLLHLDGLVDAADGLLPPLGDRARRLEVMADPNAGAFGIGATVCLLVLRWAALSALAPSVLLLGAVWCLSRTVMAVVTRAVPYARAGGLATPFLAHGDADVAASRPAHAGSVAVVGLAVAVPLADVGNGWPGVASLAVAAAAGALVVAVAVRRIGGFTGDVLGAAGMVAETAGLLVAAARW